MEKIYIEKNKNNKNKTSNRSIILSFAFAFVALVSLIAYGIGKISFAIPEEDATPFPDKVTMGTFSEDYAIYGMNGDFRIPLHTANINGADTYVYCVEADINIESGKEYTKDSEITDAGLVFITKYLVSGDYKIVDSTGAEVDEKTKGWLIQTAIWSYQYSVGATNNTVRLNKTIVDTFRTEKELRTNTNVVPFYTSSTPLYEACKVNNSDLEDPSIGGIVDYALKIHNGQTKWSQFSINITKKSDTVSLTSDEKYYQSDLVTITPSTTGFKGYKIDLPKAPEGTYLINTNNEEIKDLDNILEGTQFYVRVPVNKITENNKKVTITVTGAFEGSVAYKYIAQDSQAVIFPGKVTKHVSNGLDLSFNYTPSVPDTGLDGTVTIYLIGLFILLTGVGIIYANVRPSKAN